MNKQEIFDKVYLGLKSQNFEQSYSGGACMYRSPNGLKCAAGWLIPDEMYCEIYEGFSAEHPFIRQQMFGQFDDQQIAFIQALQELHDNCADPDDMQRILNNFAELHKLTVPQGK